MRGKRKTTKPAMQPHTHAHPGIEMDGHGLPIEMSERLPEDREKVRRATQKKRAKPKEI